MKKYLILVCLLLIPLRISAKDITSTSTYKIENLESSKLKDNNENSYLTLNENQKITITNSEDIYGIYIIYEMQSQKGNIISNGKSIALGNNNFLHEYVDLKKENAVSQSIELNYPTSVKIGEIYTIGEGDIPDYVEIWDKPCELADLILFSTHSDDEQLFFLGLLPTYVAKGANVQVVYFANHNDNPKRLHEQLHGLYTVGIRNYPIMGLIPDAWSEDLDGALSNLKKANLTEEDTLNFEVEMIRRFKPQVIVGHDEKGEYSHGQHILNTYILEQAIEKANDKTYHLDSYNKYGLWNTPKTYLHLYKENPIIMDYDTPLEYFNGKTAYEVSKEGYSKHLSQQWTWFTKWIKGKNNEYTKSTNIKTYSPNEFGLYRSLVGNDILKNDMFENLTFRKYQKEEEKTENEEPTNNTLEKEEQLTKENNLINFVKDYKYYIIGVGTFIIILIIGKCLFKRKK